MTSNTFGKIFKFSTFGESHGEAIGCIVDGVPPRLDLNEENIQMWLNKRRPGQNKFTTQRNEPDKINILSGVFEGKTTGTPVGLLINNIDARSKDYSDISEKFRPGHADYTYWKKYGIRDYRGGGRSSARETAMRVAAGAIARKVLSSLCNKDIQIRGALTQLGPHKINAKKWDWSQVSKNPFFCPDIDSVETWTDFLTSVRKNGSSTGAIIEIHATGIPPGLGSPIYGKLDAEISSALMSINAAKGIEIGNGFKSVELSGEQNADEMRDAGNKKVDFLSNNAGGILGGISSGQDIIARLAIKPTSSVLNPKKTIDIYNNNTEIITKGRHDPCVAIRGVPVAEAMLSIVLADQFLQQRAIENNN